MTNILKDMAAILNIAELAGPEAAKKMIENNVKKAAIESAETASKKLLNAQKKELQKQDNDNSKVTGKEPSQEVSSHETSSSETAVEGQNSESDIQDTVEISQNAQKALDFDSNE